MYKKEDLRKLENTDREFYGIFSRFAFEEAAKQSVLDDKTASVVILASLTAQNVRGGLFGAAVSSCLYAGVSPEEIKETVYHCAPYCGAARIWSALDEINRVFAGNGVSADTAADRTVSAEDRFAAGLAAQKSIFGDVIDKNRADAPEGQKHIQDFLSANCFGDFYTRKRLDLKMRELITFTAIISIGGCEAQAKGHAMGNAAVGNGKDVLVGAVTLLVPYIGYPRSLNALACVNAVLKD